MSSFTKRSSSIENALAKDVLKRELKQSDVSKIYSSFNTLWLNGYFPEITYHDSDWEDEMDWAEAESWYTSVAASDPRRILLVCRTTRRRAAYDCAAAPVSETLRL